MSEPLTPSVTHVAGLAIFGVSTGLDPATLIAGFAGGLWAQSYTAPTTITRRMAATSLATIVSGYLAPSVAVGLVSSNLLPVAITTQMIQLPIAVLIGLTAHKVLGPAIIRIATKRAEQEHQK